MQESLDSAICFYLLRDDSMRVAAIIGGFKTDRRIANEPHKDCTHSRK